MYHLVYLTTNLKNNKFYIGIHSTWNLDDGYLGSGTNLKNAVKKYGKTSFTRQVLYYCLTFEHAVDIERQIVDHYLIKLKNCYNISLGGAFGPVGKLNSRKNKTLEEFYGIEKAYEIKQKQKQIRTGKKHSEETKAKMSANNYSKTNEGRKRLSERATGRVFSKESIEKRSAKRRGIKQSEETKAKKSAAAAGKIQSKETKLKKALTMAKIWEERLANGYTPKKHSQESKDIRSQKMKEIWAERKLQQ